MPDLVTGVSQRNPDGTWSPATPLRPGRSVRVESWLRRHHMGWAANVLASLDERGLG